MKKILIFCTVSLLLNSCTPDCEPYEIDRFLISDSNKEYLLPEKRTDNYINNLDETVEIEFEKVGISFGRYSDDHECGYTSYEKVEQIFRFANYYGRIEIGNGSMYIILSDYVVNNQFETYSNQTTDLNQLTNDVSMAGFSFSKVLKLEQTNNDEHAIWDIKTILYSKEHGIEFILFRDNTWLKKVIN